MQEIVDYLKKQADETYQIFISNLSPTVSPETILGVRTPVLRTYAKQLVKEGKEQEFLQELPHQYFEENQLHGFIISERKDFTQCMKELETFLPYMDNWATCDQTSPKILKKHKQELLPYIQSWIHSDHTYTVRFAIGMLMQHYLDDAFDPAYLELVSSVKSEEYYINMEIAWYMATALAKQWDTAAAWLEQGTMEKWVHNKTIQKARESNRITPEKKEYLKTLKK